MHHPNIIDTQAIYNNVAYFSRLTRKVCQGIHQQKQINHPNVIDSQRIYNIAVTSNAQFYS